MGVLLVFDLKVLEKPESCTCT